MNEQGVVGHKAEIVQQTASGDSNPWDGSEALIFVGFRITWPRHVSDFEHNQDFAKQCEKDFHHWNIRGRVVDLSNFDIQHFVRLEDGTAYFASESARGYDQAIVHVSQLLKALVGSHDEPAIVNIEAQFLLPVDKPFKELVAHLDRALMNPMVRDSIKATTVDFAYLVDMLVDGVWRQVNIGPVREREIAGRVAARALTDLPTVAIFLSVTSRKAFKYELSDLSSLVCDTGRLGQGILGSIRI